MRIAGLAVAMLCPVVLMAQEACSRDAMIVFDGSGSMAEMGFNQIDEPRIFDARRAMARVVPQVSPLRKLGLVTYGPGGADECSGVDLRFPPISEAAGPVLDAVNGLQPEGSTPLTEAVRRAAEVLGASGGEVVLVTDGKETCGGAPCQLAVDLAERGVTLHVIGFRVRGAHFAWGSEGASDYRDAQTPASCLADATGGLYVRAETLDELIGALQTTLGCEVLM